MLASGVVMMGSGFVLALILYIVAKENNRSRNLGVVAVWLYMCVVCLTTINVGLCFVLSAFIIELLMWMQ